MKIKELHLLFLHSDGISTDTRKIKENSLFFALKGDNFNGNSFAAEALEKGAACAIVDEESDKKSERILKVDNVLATLQQLAYFHRRFLNIPILALTGSNGKTTTKELINAVLSQKFRTKATAGNLNNHIGVPLSLLSMNKQTEMGIVEMGANHPGEIKLLCSIAAPDYGYITNFGKAHLEGFGSLEGVMKAKSELYDYLKENNGMLFLNNDDSIQNQQNSYSRIFSFGTEKPADVVLEFFSPQNSF
ncbi:MAG TPA: UDP-N-acetylmuramoyl-tripeptide--D-alanyl-D-alanine ligase, partial [Salinimicrobium sp.]|nr:UDP-N-acetylmuramoyl-tripeptide--D-alanyl-D-alanine ligase [Salinimicrobium sp.]